MATEQLEFGPIYGKDQTSETAISTRLQEDVNQGVEETSEDWVDTRTGSIFQILLGTIVQELGRVWDALSVEVPSAAFPTRAWGDYLDEWMAAFNKERTSANPAVGVVLFTGVEGALVPAQTRLSAVQTDPNIAPPEFKTTDSGGVITSLLTAPIVAIAKSVGGTLTAETNYYYYVTSVNAVGETKAGTEKTIKTGTTEKQIKLTWPAITGATGYKIYRSTATGEGTKKLIAETANVEFLDTGFPTEEVTLPTENNTGGKYLAPIEALDAGRAGNVGANAITLILDSLSGVETATNPEPTRNGADEQDDDRLRTRLLLEFQGSGSGNQTDYERWSLGVPGIGVVTVIPVAEGPGTVKVVVMDPDGDPVSEDLVDDLQAILDPLPGQGAGLAPIDHTVTVVTASQKLMTVAAEIDFDEGFTLDGVAGTVELRGVIQEAISEYVDGLLSGEDVIYDRVKAAIYSVEGVHKVLALTLNGGSADIVVTTTPAQTASLSTPVTLTE